MLIKIIKNFLCLLLLTSVFQVQAVSPTYTSTFSSLAIKGYDTVAYFIEDKAVKGMSEFAHEYKEAIWLFSSQSNLELFIANPEQYAPQYGGYCAYAVSQNKTASIKPELFTIYNDKLYLNYNKKINIQWLQEKESYIETADKNWPVLLNN